MLYLCVAGHLQTSYDLDVMDENLHGQTCGYTHNIFQRVIIGILLEQALAAKILA